MKNKVDEKTILKRNQRIIDFFTKRNLNVKLTGNFESPAIIFEDDICLSCYVHNFNLVLTDKPFDSEKLHTVKLTVENINNNDEEFNKSIVNWVLNSEHRVVYFVYFIIGNSKMYLNEFTFDNKENTKYPVFSYKNPKIYFNLDTVKNIQQKFSNENIKLLISNNN